MWRLVSTNNPNKRKREKEIKEMKKVLSTVAALGLIAGFAAIASAADVPQTSPATGKETPAKPTAPGVSLFSVTGSYSVAGAYLSDSTSPGTATGGRVAVVTNNLPTAAVANGSDAFYFHSFILNPVLKVNDNIQVKADIRLADRHIWGMNDTTQAAVTDGRVVDANKIWMEYESPIGKWSIGRTPSGAWYHDFMNSGARANRIVYAPNMLPEPFFMLALLEKQTEEDVAANTAALGSLRANDQDKDMYLVHVGYKADMGTSVLGYFLTRDATTPKTAAGTLLQPDVKHSHTIKFYGKYNIAGFNLETEISHGLGEAVVNGTATERDIDNWAAFVEAGTTVGAANIGAFYFYMSGDNNTTDNEYQGAMGTAGVGNDFNPFQILTGDWMGMLNADKGGVHPFLAGSTPTGGGAAVANGTDPGVHAVGLKASTAVNDKLTLSGTIGAAWADEVNISINADAVASTVVGQNDDYGWEIDLGASYKLLDNLTYGVHFGYLNLGDYWLRGNMKAAGDETNNVYLLAHQLVMKF